MFDESILELEAIEFERIGGIPYDWLGNPLKIQPVCTSGNHWYEICSFKTDYGYRRFTRQLGLYIGYVGIGYDSLLFSESYLLNLF